MIIPTLQKPNPHRTVYVCKECGRYWQWDGSYGQLILDPIIDEQLISDHPPKENKCYRCNFRLREVDV